MEELSRLVNLIIDYRSENPGQRLGQASLNVLFIEYPDFAESFMDADPFYDDSKLPAFWSKVVDMLMEPPADNLTTYRALNGHEYYQDDHAGKHNATHADTCSACNPGPGDEPWYDDGMR